MIGLTGSDLRPSERLKEIQDIAKRVPDFKLNWRAQMYLFRARFDANVQVETRAQQRYEKEAHVALAEASQVSVRKAIDNARAALAHADKPAAPHLRSGIEALGPLLLESIGYQLSVKPPYRAAGTERSAMLDWLDQPLNDRPWLEQRFEAILALEDNSEQLARIDTLLNWEDPGPGFCEKRIRCPIDSAKNARNCITCAYFYSNQTICIGCWCMRFCIYSIAIQRCF